jgi:phosphonate transport system substrate-binding protein
MVRIGSIFIFLAATMVLACGKTNPEARQIQQAKAAEKVQVREARKELVITAIPDEKPDELQRKNNLLVDYLEKSMGVKISFKPVTHYGAAVRALVAGQVDFAWLGGYTFVQAKLQANAIPVVMRRSDRAFQSVFIANKDSGIATMADLKGKTFAFGSKSSTSGRLMPQHYMVQNFQLDPTKDLHGVPVYSGAHDATLKMVDSGKVQAGVLNYKTWETNKGSAPNTVEVWRTPGYVDYCWAAAPGVSSALRQKFADAFIALNEAEHPELLALQSAQKYVPAQVAMWDTIQQVATEAGLIQ